MDSSSSVLSDQLKADFKRLYFRRTFNFDEKSAWLATFPQNETPSCNICISEHKECIIRSGVSIRCESCSGIKRCSNVENFKRWIITSNLAIDDVTYNALQDFFEKEGALKASASNARVNESTRASATAKVSDASESELVPASDVVTVRKGLSHDSGSDTEASYPPQPLVPVRKAISRTTSSASVHARVHASSPASSVAPESTPEPPSMSAHAGSGGRGPCTTCGRTHSPMWRKGPLGPSTLCNACGLKYAKDPSLLNNVTRASATPSGSSERPRGSHGSRDIAGPCRSCGRKESPLWRRGPAGPKTLCNACGLRFVNHPETFGAHASGVPVRDTTTAASVSAPVRPAPTRNISTKRHALSAEDELFYLRRRNKELESEKARNLRELEYLEAELDRANEGQRRMEVVKTVYEGRIRKLKADLVSTGKDIRSFDEEDYLMEDRSAYGRQRAALPTPSHTDESSDDSETTFAAASAMLMLFKGKGKRSRFDTPPVSSEDEENVQASVPPSKRRRLEATGPSMASFAVPAGTTAMAVA